MKYLPNALSVSRIIVSMLLIFIIRDITVFGILYVFCGLTDALDGFFARKFNVQSDFGARLDTVGDIFFFALIVLIVITRLSTVWVILLAVVFAVRVCGFIISKIRFGEFASIHTIGNKISGFLCFFIPVFIMAKADFMNAIVFIFAFLSAIEELIIHIKSNKLELNRKSLFVENKGEK